MKNDLTPGMGVIPMSENDRKTIIERLRSWPVWLSVIGQVVVVVALINPEIAETVRIVMTAVGEIATAFGILNNPASTTNF